MVHKNIQHGIFMFTYHMINDVPSGSDTTSCITIDKQFVDYIFSKSLLSGKIVSFACQKCDFTVLFVSYDK